MRITNVMTANKMLLNINRNSTVIDNLYEQYTTGKKIQNPSDNPIIASRALKFRTNISMTVQYMRNVSQGLSWMKITEQGFSNTQNVLTTIRERCDYGASDTFEYTDRQKIVTEIRTLLDQIGSEMNIQYAGRYVFSGYRTDESPVLEEASENTYNITQNLTFDDIEKVKIYVKTGADEKPVVTEVYRLKLPYNTEVTDVKIGYDTNSLITLDTYSSSSEEGYMPSSYDADSDGIIDNTNKAHYIAETGEIILSEAYVQEIRQNASADITITYTKSNFSVGELNPRVYFTCEDVTDPANPVQYNMDNQELKFEFGVNTRITINNLAKDVFTPSMYADLKVLCDIISDIELTSDALLQEKYSAANNPGKTTEELEAMKNEQIAQEQQLYRGVMQDMFSNMLSIIDRHASVASTEETNLGSRMVRLNMIEERLEADRVSYTDLMSDNENVDYLEVLMNLKTAESVYNAALKAGTSIMQLSLADFI